MQSRSYRSCQALLDPQMTVMTLSCLCLPPKSYFCSKLTPGPQWKRQPTEEGAPSEEKKL